MSLSTPSANSPGYQQRKPQDLGTQQQINTNDDGYDAAQTQATQGTPAVATPTDAAATTAPTAPADIATPYSLDELHRTFLELGIAPEDYDYALALLQNQLSVSDENMGSLKSLLKGQQDAQSIQSAILSLLKGFDQDSNIVNFLTQFLSQSDAMNGEIKKLQKAINSLLAALKGEQFDPKLVAQLSALLLAFDEDLKELMNKDPKKALHKRVTQMGDLVNNSMGLHQLLEGLIEKEFPEGFTKALSEFKGGVHDFLGHLFSQLAISKKPDIPMGLSDDYAFFQIPNTQSNSVFDIYVQRHANPSAESQLKTKLVIHTQTESLGEITAILDVKNDDVWAAFNVDNEAGVDLIRSLESEFDGQMGDLGYKLRKFQSVNQLVNMEKYRMPQSQDGLNIQNIQATV